MLPKDVMAPFVAAGWGPTELPLMVHEGRYVTIKPSRSQRARPGGLQVVLAGEAGTHVMEVGPEHVMAVASHLAARGPRLDPERDEILLECAALGARVSERGRWRAIHEPNPYAVPAEPVAPGDEPWREVFLDHGWQWDLTPPGSEGSHWELADIRAHDDDWTIDVRWIRRGLSHRRFRARGAGTETLGLLVEWLGRGRKVREPELPGVTWAGVHGDDDEDEDDLLEDDDLLEE